jgi:hypothetical protein
LARAARENPLGREPNGVVEFSPFDFLDRLSALVPPPRKQRHCYDGVFAPNHKLRPAVHGTRHR